MEYHPPGGFSNFLRDLNGASSFPFPPSSHPLHPGHHMPGFPFPYHPQFMVPPATSSSVRGSPFASDSRSPSPANIGQHRVSANGEVDEESRQRMYYTDEEDIRLVSAWLNNSTDPVEGNSKKSARYWEEVAVAYNDTTPSDRKRDVKLLKSHWYKTTKKISSFNGCYNQMKDTYMSGRSDDQLMDQALELYRSRNKHHFTYVHWWRAVRDSPKWNAHITAEGQGTKRSGPEVDVNKAPPNVRPIGCKKAKKMKGIGNGAASTVVEQQLEKLVNARTEINAGISDMKDFQERLSTQKVEAAKLSYMAAKENKESKMLENKSKMMEHRSKLMDKFSEMLNVDTSKMEAWAKQVHLRAVTALSDELFGREGATQTDNIV